MKPETARKLVEPFDKKKIKKSPKGLDYAPVAEVINRCNAVIGHGNWQCEIMETFTFGVQETSFGPAPTQIIAKARVHVKDNETGEWSFHEGYGGHDVGFYKDKARGPMDLGDAYKSACSDAMKKALQHFGVGLELARDGIPSEVYEETVDVVPEINFVDSAQLPRFTDAQKSAMKQAWGQKFPGIKADKVPGSKADEVRAFIASFEITQPAPKEETLPLSPKSDVPINVPFVWPAYVGPYVPQAARKEMAGVFQALVPDLEERRTEVRDIWTESGYEGMEFIAEEEWNVLKTFVQERFYELIKEDNKNAADAKGYNGE